MKTILVLGHKGMLGDAVYRYFSSKENLYTVLTVSSRWDIEEFKKELSETEAEIIINCVGIIPQKKPAPEEYQKVNVELPIFLESLGKKVIHPSTDCEFSGTTDETYKYTKRDIRNADDIYGKSKADISKLIEDTFLHTKIIRTSIIGHEQSTSLSLLDWFLSQEGETRGYTNHYWNGITTLQWAKESEMLINSWETLPKLNQFGTESILSKYEILTLAKEIYHKEITINPFATPITVNKCLTSDKPMPSLRTQLEELKSFYNK